MIMMNILFNNLINNLHDDNNSLIEFILYMKIKFLY